MKKTLTTIAIGVLLILAGWAVRAGGEPTQTIASSTSPIRLLTDRQEIWINALEWCESRDMPNAINPRDKDNTPSYGILQFKPSTYAYYAKKYGLGSTTDYMNPAGQKAIVKGMILDDTVNWQKQFPDCVRKLDHPPKT